jgi:periplasmic protein TonB
MSSAFVVTLPRRRAVLLLAMLLVGAGMVWLARGGGVPAAGTNAADAADTSATAILLELAATAVRERRLLAPAGSNAYEFYFSVLQLDPANAVARQGQQRLFPAAAAELEQAINRGELDEAQRELALLREFDRDNFTLALLGGKLDARRQLVVRADEARAAAIQARAAAANQP